jgi:hypothetical protein
MLVLPPPDSDLSILMIEGGLTTIAIATAFCWPRLATSYFSRIERAFTQIAHRRGLAVALVGFGALFLRLAILPFSPIPLPFVPDDFSFLLSADTFAHGRLTNPTPAMWVHFETIHLTMKPTYMSMYFPSTGLLLAASKLLLGHPWYGILCMSALMCAAICWMLQAWLPPTWALLGGIIAILRLGLFSYWVNTYSGGGSISTIGGALILGSLPRLMKSKPLGYRYGLLLALGIVLVATTRPYEGLLLCLPVAVVLGRWIFFGKNRPPLGLLLRRAAAPLALIIAAGSWMAFYDYRAFGSPTTLPYSADRAAYATAPYFVWQPPRPTPVYRHEVLREFYHHNELIAYERIHRLSGFLPETAIKAVRGILFFTGIALLPPLIMIRRVFLDRRIRFLVVCILVFAAGMLIQIFMIPHYLAPFTVVFYAIGLQAMRHLRVWKPEGKTVGLTLVRLIVVVCIALGGLRLFAEPLHFRITQWPASGWTDRWYGPNHFGTERAGIETTLEQLPGKQLILVRYAPDHNPIDEWVYNSADIDGSKVIWAREMDMSNNSELIQYYKDRQVWLVEPDSMPAKLSRYPMPPQPVSAAH